MYMKLWKKLLGVLVCCVSLLPVHGCRVYIPDWNKQENKRLEALLEAIQEEDREGLKAMFSPRAIEEAEDFDAGMDYLLSMFQGEVQSWEIPGGGGGPVRESIRPNGRSVSIRARYTVVTDQDTYTFLMLDYLMDTLEPDREGLYTLRVIRQADEETQPAWYWEDIILPGIYRPEQEE